MEPTSGQVEAGCQGTLRVQVTVPGTRAHSARGWLGDNAIHAAAPLLAALVRYEPREVEIDGCTYREGLNAVRIEGGVAGNVIPDACTVTVNFRFAPDRTEEQALAHVREVLAPYDCVLTDTSPGALPGLTAPAAQHFLAAVGGDAAWPSTAGPTSRASPPWGSPRSTTARATPASPTPARSGSTCG